MIQIDIGHRVHKKHVLDNYLILKSSTIRSFEAKIIMTGNY